MFCRKIKVFIKSVYWLVNLLKPNSIMLSSSLAGIADQFATKFHYTIQLATSWRTGLRPARELVRELDEDVCVHVVCVSQAKFHYAVQLASRSATTGRRPASEQDSVIEYGLNRFATRFELSRHVEIARTCLQQVCDQVCNQICDLDSVMEFSQSRSQISSRTSS